MYRTLRDLISRSLVLLSTAALAGGSRAQDSQGTALTFHLSRLPGEHMEKVIQENLRGFDPACSVHLERRDSTLDLRSPSGLANEAYLDVLASAGVPPITLVEDHSARSPITDGLQAIHGFPAYVATGHPAEDDLRYQEAKKAWIEGHPDEYLKATGPQR